MEKWSKDEMFGLRHKIERQLKKAKHQLTKEIRLQLKEDMRDLASFMLDASYDFIMPLL